MQKKKSYTVKEALAKMQHFCVYRERCHKEVQKKLKSLHMIPQARDQIMVQLIEENFLNEERFAKTFVHDKFKLKKWGKHRLIRELKFRQISDHLITKALDQIDEEDYQKTFDILLKKRLGNTKEKHPLKIKRKLTDYLLRKGYDATQIYDALDQLDFCPPTH